MTSTREYHSSFVYLNMLEGGLSISHRYIGRITVFVRWCEGQPAHRGTHLVRRKEGSSITSDTYGRIPLGFPTPLSLSLREGATDRRSDDFLFFKTSRKSMCGMLSIDTRVSPELFGLIVVRESRRERERDGLTRTGEGETE